MGKTPYERRVTLELPQTLARRDSSSAAQRRPGEGVCSLQLQELARLCLKDQLLLGGGQIEGPQLQRKPVLTGARGDKGCLPQRGSAICRRIKLFPAAIALARAVHTFVCPPPAFLLIPGQGQQALFQLAPMAGQKIPASPTGDAGGDRRPAPSMVDARRLGKPCLGAQLPSSSSRERTPTG